MDKSLVPPLRSVLEPQHTLSLADGFVEGDLLHLLANVARRPACTVLPVLGQCACYDAAGQLWRLLAYVPASPLDCTTYAGRQASRFPEAGQKERWFAGVHLRFTEIDITYSAEALALERHREAVVIAMYPTRSTARPAAMRKAA